MKLALLGSALALVSFSSALAAEGRTPGTCLIYPIHRSAPGWFSVLNITNTNLAPATPQSFGGTTNVMFQYVNKMPGAGGTLQDCFIVDRVESLTPGDTLSVLTSWHNAANQEGFVVAVAQDPALFKTDWQFDYLTGSELVVNAAGGMYSINAIPVSSSATWDGEGTSEGFGIQKGLLQSMGSEVILDGFLAVADSQLTMLSPDPLIPSGADFGSFPSIVLEFDVFNDNEFQLSATSTFRCWFEESLRDISLVFDETFLANNTPHDPTQLDIDGDGVNDLETGWARIRSNVAFTASQQAFSPPIHGAITDGPTSFIDGGRLLWEPKGYWGPTPEVDLAVAVEVDDSNPSELDVAGLCYSVTNLSPYTTATNVVVEFEVPEGLTPDASSAIFQSFTPGCGGEIAFNGGDGRVELECLAPGDTAKVAFVATVDFGAAGQVISLGASASSDQVDTQPVNNTAVTSLTVMDNGFVDLSASPGNDTAQPLESSVFVHILSAYNSELGATATGAVTSITLPAGLSVFSSIPSIGSFSEVTNEWSLGDLAPGVGGTLVLGVLVAPGTAGQSLEITAQIASDQVDPFPGNDTSVLTVIPQ